MASSLLHISDKHFDGETAKKLFTANLANTNIRRQSFDILLSIDY